jgi:hypothetical protein
MIIKIYNKDTHLQVAETSLSHLMNEGWTSWREFVELQQLSNRECVLVEDTTKGDDDVSDR